MIISAKCSGHLICGRLAEKGVGAKVLLLMLEGRPPLVRGVPVLSRGFYAAQCHQ